MLERIERRRAIRGAGSPALRTYVSLGPGRIEVVKTDDMIAEFAGIFDDAVYPPAYLDEVRRGWE